MEKNQKLMLGGLVLAGALVGAAYFGGFLNNENDAIRRAAAVAGPSVAQKTPAIGQTDPAPQPTGPATAIVYENDVFDYGIVDEGQIVKHTFKFKNTGNEPLVISNARASCGCTVPSWPKEAIAPGASGIIDVSFDSKGKPGKQSKRVTVVANTNPTETFLTIQGEVRGKEQPTTVKGN